MFDEFQCGQIPPIQQIQFPIQADSCAWLSSAHTETAHSFARSNFMAMSSGMKCHTTIMSWEAVIIQELLYVFSFQ